MTGGAIARLGNRIAPPRFLAFLLLLPLSFVAWRWLVQTSDWRDGVAMAFDISAFAFLASLVPLLRDSKVADIRRHASQNDANRLLILIVTVLLTLVVMAAISIELKQAGQGDALAIAKLVITLLLAWLFANAVYTLHYAHCWYAPDSQGSDTGGLEFPGSPTPDYEDFAYFAFTIGMTFQTSDWRSPARRFAASCCCTVSRPSSSTSGSSRSPSTCWADKRHENVSIAPLAQSSRCTAA